MSSQKWTSLQALRGIGCLAVLLAHMMYLEAQVMPGEHLLPTFDCLSLSALDLFFVMSGFAMVQALHRTRSKSQPFWRFVWQRMARVFPLYWFYTALLGMAFLVFPHSLTSEQWRAYDGNFLKSALLLPPANNTVLMVGWTLVHEVYFYVALALVGLAGEKRLLRLLGVWAALVVIGRYTLLKGPALFSNDVTMLLCDTRALQFIGGCLAGIAIQKSFAFSGRRAFWGGISIAVAASLLEGFGIMRLSSWPRLALVTAPLAFALIGLVAAERQNRPVRFPRWLIRMGDASYSTYLGHMLVISLVADVWLLVAVPGLIDNAVALLCMVGASLLVGELSFRYVESPLLALTAWPPLIGAWKPRSTATAVRTAAEPAQALPATAFILQIASPQLADDLPAAPLIASDSYSQYETEPAILRMPSPRTPAESQPAHANPARKAA